MTATPSAPEAFDYRVFAAVQRTKVEKPPYDPTLPITPLSVFGDDIWSYPKKALPAGHRQETGVVFVSRHRVPKGRTFTFGAGTHPVLMNQLKETLYAFIFYRHLIPWRLDVIRPRTIIGEGKQLSSLFANIAAAGVTSLAQVDQTILTKIFADLELSARAHRAFVDYIRDMVVFSRHGLISDPFLLTNATIDSLEEATEVGAQIGALTLDEHQVSCLLRLSEGYVDQVEDIAARIVDQRAGRCTCQELVDWAYSNLEIKRGLVPHLAEKQIIWLVKIAIYQLLVYHLGSRASEALSAGLDSIFSRQRDDAPQEAYISLLIFKGSKKGELRTYRTHPYFLRLATAARKLAAAVGHPPDALIFSLNDPYQEVVNSQLNHKLRRFAWMHGLSILLSSHSWRFTLSDIVAGSAENAFFALQYELGHEHLKQAIAYGLHGPQGDVLREAAAAAATAAVDDFVAQCKEQANLGGVQGTAITSMLKEGTPIEEVGEQLQALSVVPIKLDVNRYCVKQPHVKGACSAVTGDALPEIEQCQGGACIYQVQFESVRDEWFDFLKHAEVYYSDKEISVLEKINTTHKLMQDVSAWPELKRELHHLLHMKPSLRMWFESNGF